MGLRERVEAELTRREWIVAATEWDMMVRPRHEGNEEFVQNHDPADASARYAAARRVLALVDKLRRHEAKRREITPLSGFADDLRAYADELEVSVAASLGIV